MYSSGWSWNTTRYLKDGGKKTASLKKNLCGKNLGPLACEPEHDSWIIFVFFSLFEPKDSYSKNSYKKLRISIFSSIL